MKSFWKNLHKIGDFLHLPDLPNWLLGILALVLILRIPSFFEPYYYGDEMVYLTLGQGVRQGLTLYKDLYDNKPPLLYLTAAFAGNLFWFKAILAFWNLITVVLFYKLAQKIFSKNEGVQKISTLIFAILTTIPLFEGNTVNSELFMIGFAIWAFVILLKEKVSSKNIFWAGFLFGIGTLFKVPAAFDAPVIVFYWIITKGFREWKEILKDTLILFSGFLTPIILTVIYYFFAGALKEYLTAAFLQNIGYLSSFRPGDIKKPFYIRNAPLLIRAFLVLAGALVIYLFRKKLSKKFILLTLWVLFALFAITLSERPYPHYFIQILAPVSFLFGMFFAEKTLEQSLAVLPLAAAFFVPVFYKFYFYPTGAYYLRFINFAAGKMSKEAYFDTFSKTTSRNYEIADFIAKSSTTNDRVFMWDPDSAAVYALSRRLPPEKYVVPYHVYDYSNTKDTAQALTKNPPKFIILTAGNSYPELNFLISQKYILITQIDDANIYSRSYFAK